MVTVMRVLKISQSVRFLNRLGALFIGRDWWIRYNLVLLRFIYQGSVETGQFSTSSQKFVNK